MLLYNNINIVCSEAKELIYEYGEKMFCKEGEVLISPNAKIENLYFIDRGRFRHLYVDNNGNNHISRIEESNSFIALSPIITSTTNQQIYVCAEKDSIVYKISKETLYFLIDSSKTFRECILVSLANKELNIAHQSELLSLKTIKEKVYCFLAQYIDNEQSTENEWHHLKYDYNQQDIADFISSTKISVWKAMNELCEEGCLRIVNKKIQISLGKNTKYDVYKFN